MSGADQCVTHLAARAGWTGRQKHLRRKYGRLTVPTKPVIIGLLWATLQTRRRHRAGPCHKVTLTYQLIICDLVTQDIRGTTSSRDGLGQGIRGTTLSKDGLGHIGTN